MMMLDLVLIWFGYPKTAGVSLENMQLRLEHDAQTQRL